MFCIFLHIFILPIYLCLKQYNVVTHVMFNDLYRNVLLMFLNNNNTCLNCYSVTRVTDGLYVFTYNVTYVTGARNHMINVTRWHIFCIAYCILLLMLVLRILTVASGNLLNKWVILIRMYRVYFYHSSTTIVHRGFSSLYLLFMANLSK